MPVYLAGYGYANVASVEQSQQEVLDTLNGPFSLHYYSKGVVQEARVFYLRPIVVTSSSKIAPAIVETDAVRTLFGAEAANLVRHAADHNPSGRGVVASDYTNLMRWLASPQAEFIQGQVVFVNGGANLSA